MGKGNTKADKLAKITAETERLIRSGERKASKGSAGCDVAAQDAIVDQSGGLEMSEAVIERLERECGTGS
jgi:hypothetical protein